jgi:G3E family GTPase
MTTEHDDAKDQDHHHHHDHHGKVEVSVSTTSGFFPTEGFNHVPVEQKVEVELERAKHELKIKDTTNWVASINGPHGKRFINAAQSYRENGLSGKVEIDWGPSEGGGG